jgi:lipopolysaccharide export system protein LptC
VNAKQLLLLTALLAGAAVSGWLLRGQDILAERAVPSPRGPDLFVEGMDLSILGDDGNPRYRVQASRLDHYPYDDHSELTSPVMEVFSDRQTVWNARSEHGRVADHGDNVWLLGRVEIRRPPQNGQRPLKVVTSDLLVKPQADTAETTAPAVIESGAYRIEGVGMLANLRESRLDLRSRVRGRIDAGS